MAFGLVVLSMWRVFAVRPRFWFANIQTNLVSAIVNVSYVTFLYMAGMGGASDSTTILIQLILATLYILWLLLLKPQSKRVYVALQAAVALFVGMTAVYMMLYGWWSSAVVVIVWLIGYATARHVLGSYDEESHSMFLSLVWGLILAEIGWLTYHWTIAYKLPFIVDVPLPQVSIISLSLGFLVYKSYDSYYHNGKIRLTDVAFPMIFTISIIALLVLAFNGYQAVV